MKLEKKKIKDLTVYESRKICTTFDRCINGCPIYIDRCCSICTISGINETKLNQEIELEVEEDA